MYKESIKTPIQALNNRLIMYSLWKNGTMTAGIFLSSIIE